MKQFNLLLLAFVALLASCNTNKAKYENATSFTYTDFKNQKDLKATTLEFDSLIMRAVDLVAFDSLLITIEMGKENIFHVYNMKTKKHINQSVKRGQGPEDMIYPEFMNSDANCLRVFDLQTSTVYEYDVQDFMTNPTPSPTKRTKLENQVFTMAEQVDDKIFGNAYYGVDEQLYVFDLNGKKIGTIIDYPPSSIPHTEMEKVDAYYKKFTSNGKDKLAFCYYMTDLIEIYNLDGTLQKRIHGPEQFFTHFKEYQDGRIGASPVKDLNRDAFMCPKNAGDEFFVLYNGGFIDEPDHSSSSKQLFSFSWDGTPQTIYTLDDPIYHFSVDSENKKIYGISITPEYHVVEYSYEETIKASQ